VPKADYDPGSMNQTVVPGRNLIFASVLAALAESRGGGHVALATHSGDHYLYPDCRPAFNESLAQTVQAGSDGAVGLFAPFAALSKADIVGIGRRLKVPFELTRSCYEDSPQSCGACGTCRERLQAFAANGIVDPIEYLAG
jgi:7-cyano-7-deazaguanine synthase